MHFHVQELPTLGSSELSVMWFVIFWAVEGTCSCKPCFAGFNLCLSGVMLQMRIHALYRSRRLTIFNGVIFGVVMGTMLFLLVYIRPATCRQDVSKFHHTLTVTRYSGNGGTLLSRKQCFVPSSGTLPLYWIPGAR